jgi:hypothetical protein
MEILSTRRADLEELLVLRVHLEIDLRPISAAVYLASMVQARSPLCAQMEPKRLTRRVTR